MKVLPLLFVALTALTPSLAHAECTCGEPAGTVPVCTPADFVALQTVANGVPARLCRDIDFGGAVYSNWVVDRLRGSLSGNGRTIKNVVIQQTSTTLWAGIFGTTLNSPPLVIDNLTLENVRVTGQRSFGALLGSAATATLQNIQLKGVKVNPGKARAGQGGLLVGEVNSGSVVNGVQIDAASALENYTFGFSFDSCGGIAGLVNGTVRNVRSDARVVATAGLGAYGPNTWMGGIAGICHGVIEDSAVGGIVVGDHEVGGVCGVVDGGVLRRLDVAASVTGNYGRAAGLAAMTGLNSANTIEDVRFVGDLAGGNGSAGAIGGVTFATALRRVLIDAVLWNAGTASTIKTATVAPTITALLYNADRNAGVVEPWGTARTAATLRQAATYTGFDLSTSTTTTSTWFLDPSRMKVAELRAQRCGNTIRFISNEDCDDGNLDGMDGCANNCGIEERPIASWLGATPVSVQTMTRAQTWGIKIRFDRDGVISGLGARNTATNVWRYVSLYNDAGASITGTTFQQGPVGQMTYTAVTPVRVRAGVVYTLAIPSWGSGESVPFVSGTAFTPPFATSSIEVIGAVMSPITGFPTGTVTQAPIVDVVFAPDP